MQEEKRKETSKKEEEQQRWKDGVAREKKRGQRKITEENVREKETYDKGQEGAVKGKGRTKDDEIRENKT